MQSRRMPLPGLAVALVVGACHVSGARGQDASAGPGAQPLPRTLSEIERLLRQTEQSRNVVRRSMLDVLDRGAAIGPDGKPEYAYAHPLFWAPFSLVGDRR